MKTVTIQKIPQKKSFQVEKKGNGLTRRQLLARATVAGAAFVIGPGFMAASNGAWATELQALKPESFATLVQMARDIYPHDHIGDEYYVIAVKGYDTAENAESVEQGINELNAQAKQEGHTSYLDAGWERDRVDILRTMEDNAFFQQIRGGLVTGLYNQKTSIGYKPG